jgi:hypothetical protein
MARPQGEGEQLTAVPRRVEFVSGGPRHADVVDVDRLTGHRFGAVPELEVLDDQLTGRRSVGDGHNWFGIRSHGDDCRG